MEGKVIRTHTKAWKVEKSVHTIGDFKLPVAITLDTLLYAILGVIIAAILCKIPFIRHYAFVIYLMCIVGFPFFMRKFRVHSKTPTRFVMDYFMFLAQPKSLARFQPVKPQNPIRFTNVNFRR